MLVLYILFTNSSFLKTNQNKKCDIKEILN